MHFFLTLIIASWTWYFWVLIMKSFGLRDELAAFRFELASSWWLIFTMKGFDCLGRHFML